MANVDRGPHDDDAIDYFESSLESLFGQHQAASGQPGELCSLRLPLPNANGEQETKELVLPYRIPASTTNKLFAHYQWDAGVFTARLIHQHSRDTALPSSHDDERSTLQCREADVRNLTILELGAGTGLPSLISAKSQAKDVVVTDYPDSGILAALRENVSLMQLSGKVDVQGLDWADNEAVQRLNKQHPDGFERIVCADVLWLSSSHLPLLRTIHSLLARSNGSRCIIVSGFHTGRRALSNFFRLATQQYVESHDEKCFVLRTSTRKDGSPAVFEYNVVNHCSRPWSARTPFPSVPEDDYEHDNMDDFSERSKWLLYVSLEWSSRASTSHPSSSF